MSEAFERSLNYSR